jgi:5-methylcytosine-specific restriction endonuclease McrA
MNKICQKCGINRPVTEFSKHNACKGGHETTCKECVNKNSKLWREKHSNYDTLHSRQYRKEHITELREKERSYYWNNVEKKMVYRAGYYQKNRDFLIQSSKDDYKRHPERWRYYGEKRRCIKNGGDLQQGDFEKLCAEYGNKCLVCGSTGKLTMDHIVPISRGGVHSVANIQPLCRSCNSKKHAKTIDYRSYVPEWIIGSIEKENYNESTIRN